MAGYQRERDILSIPLFKVTDAIASFQWTLDEVQALHIGLSAAMKTEANYMAGLRAAPQQGRVNAREEPTSMQNSPWNSTIAGRPRVGATAERVRRTSMCDVDMFPR